MHEDGTMEWEWEIETIFETGDKATGTRVLQNFYSEWKDHPVNVDLPQLWRDLGVEKKGDTIVFHDDAPLASIRKAITAVR
jgi:arabinogalactan endo-1,4-beta-galactosidase